MSLNQKSVDSLFLDTNELLRRKTHKLLHMVPNENYAHQPFDLYKSSFNSMKDEDIKFKNITKRPMTSSVSQVPTAYQYPSDYEKPSSMIELLDPSDLRVLIDCLMKGDLEEHRKRSKDRPTSVSANSIFDSYSKSDDRFVDFFLVF
jgi:hypothetical protein